MLGDDGWLDRRVNSWRRGPLLWISGGVDLCSGTGYYSTAQSADAPMALTANEMASLYYCLV